MKSTRFVSGPYSDHVNPWLEAELKRETGLAIDPRDLVRIMKSLALTITCVLDDEHIVFCLMRREKMIAAIRIPRVTPPDSDDVQMSIWEGMYQWLFPCPK